jgi:tetratricopeptide (TPR) repeat protein
LKLKNLRGRIPYALCFAGVLGCLTKTSPSLGGAADGTTGRGSISIEVRKADDYYLGRQNVDNVAQAVSLLRDQVARNPRDYESWWRLSKFYNYWGRHAPDGEKLKLLRAGVEAGKQAVALEPGRVEGHFWLGASYGLIAEEGGLLDGLRLVDTIRHEMETVEKLDPDYEDGSGLRTLGRICYRAPFFKGGDRRRSVQLLEECLRRYPDNSLTMLYLAESYLAVGRREDARQMFEKILQLCPNPEYGPELADNQAAAREVLAKKFRAGQ